jgi:hypothetical protein
MPRLCKLCRERYVRRRSKREYCPYCYAHFFSVEAKLARLPSDHPFIKAREAKVQQMIARAAKGLPIFD